MKAELLELILADLRARLQRLANAAKAAHEAATDPGSKAESKYDTRSLEESYLATGQAKQVKELAQSLAVFENLKLPTFSKNDVIDAGALVETRRAGVKGSVWFLLAPSAGGLEIMWGKKEITLLSPESPLYQNLLGLKVGDSLETPPFTIKSVK